MSEKVESKPITPHLYEERGLENTSFLLKSALFAICFGGVLLAALQTDVFQSQNALNLCLVSGATLTLGLFYFGFQHANREPFGWKKILATIFLFSVVVAAFAWASFTYCTKEHAFVNLAGAGMAVGAVIIAEFVARWKFGFGEKSYEPPLTAPTFITPEIHYKEAQPVASQPLIEKPKPVITPTVSVEAPQEVYLDRRSYVYNSFLRVDREILVCENQKTLACFQPLNKLTSRLVFNLTPSQKRIIAEHIAAGRCYFQCQAQSGQYFWIYSTNPDTVPSFVQAVNLDVQTKVKTNYQVFAYRQKTILVPEDEALPEFLITSGHPKSQSLQWEECQTKRSAIGEQECCFYDKNQNVWFYSKNQFKVPPGCQSFTLREMMRSGLGLTPQMKN